MIKHLTATVAAFVFCATAATAEMPGQTPGARFLENWDLNSDGAVTRAEMIEMRGSVFASFDANADGFIDAAEYKTFDEARANDIAEVKAGQRKQMAGIANALGLKQNDRDGDNKVSRAEFLGSVDGWLAKLDRNKDGQVTADDFKLAMKQK